MTVLSLLVESRCRAAARLSLAVIAFLFFSPPSHNAFSQSLPGVAAAYSFNEAVGTTASDVSGNGLAGTLTNGPLWVAGKYGNAVRLDGINDYVNLSNPTPLRMTGSMTISAWINSSSFPPDDASIVSKRTGADSGYQLDTTVDEGPRTIGFKLTNSSGLNMARYGATPLQLNTWYHVAGVYDASARTMNVYVNAQLDNGASIGTITSTQQDSTQSVNIGQRPGLPTTFNFSGSIDDVRIYARVLTQAEIQADMNTPVGSAADAQPPTAPSALAATAVGGSQINLSWTSATDNVGVTGYRIERCLGTGCSNFTQIAAPAGTVTTYSDTSVTSGNPYSYRVRAADAAGNLSAYSNVANATTATLDTQPPTAPGTLTASVVSGTQIDLNWIAASDNVAVTGYRIERCASSGCSNFAQIAPVGVSTSYSDTGLYPAIRTVIASVLQTRPEILVRILITQPPSLQTHNRQQLQTD